MWYISVSYCNPLYITLFNFDVFFTCFNFYITFLFCSYYTTPPPLFLSPPPPPPQSYTRTSFYLYCVRPHFTSSCSYVIFVIVLRCCYGLDKYILFVSVALICFVLYFTKIILSTFFIYVLLNSIFLKPCLFRSRNKILSYHSQMQHCSVLYTIYFIIFYFLAIYSHSVSTASLNIVHRVISHSSQCSTTGVTKAMVCVILSVGWCI